METYNFHSVAFSNDLESLIATFRRSGFETASDFCDRIALARGLDASQRLTLADAFRRALILEK